MNNGAKYLKSNVMVEPLVDGWYAWAHLIPPATAARNLTERHLRIMDSYIESPETHESAVKNPALLGGPFMDLGGNRVAEVKQLRDNTVRQRSCLVTLSHRVELFDSVRQCHGAPAQLPGDTVSRYRTARRDVAGKGVG